LKRKYTKQRSNKKNLFRKRTKKLRCTEIGAKWDINTCLNYVRKKNNYFIDKITLTTFSSVLCVTLKLLKEIKICLNEFEDSKNIYNNRFGLCLDFLLKLSHDYLDQCIKTKPGFADLKGTRSLVILVEHADSFSVNS